MSDVLQLLPSSLPAGIDLARDLPIALGVLLLLVLVPVLMRRRRRRRARASGPSGATNGDPGAAGATTPRASTVRRPTREPLFTGRDTEPDALTAGLRAATGPLEVLDVLRRIDEIEAAPPAPAPTASTAPTTARPAPALSRDVPPVAWMIAGGVAALLIARLGRRGRG